MNFLLRGWGLPTILVASIALAIAAVIAVFGGWAPPYSIKLPTGNIYQDPVLDLEPISFNAIDGWRLDDQSKALPAFLRTCDRLDKLDDTAAMNPLEALGPKIKTASVAGSVLDWRAPCEEARRIGVYAYADENAYKSSVRAFFETSFSAFKVINHKEPVDPEASDVKTLREFSGLYTAYFEPVYAAFRFKTEEFSAPVFARPPDLVMVDLGAFRDQLAGQRIAGSISDGKLIPYPDHKAINDGAINKKATIIGWMRPTDLFFMQIQGSGQLEFRDGDTIRVGYDGQNGHPYTPVGRVLIEEGEVAREDMSLQAIRDWMNNAAPEDAERLREENASYVFFREVKDLDNALGPLGATQVQLTPWRSLAVDRRYHPLGAPVWVSIDAEGTSLESNLRRLFIAQDTGGAIKGPVRGDIFAGSGDQAEAAAGPFNFRGEMIILLPRDSAKKLNARIARR